MTPGPGTEIPHAVWCGKKKKKNVFSEAVPAFSVTHDPLQLHGLDPARLLCPWELPGKNAGVGGHFLLQGTFPTQGLDLSLLHLPT